MAWAPDYITVEQLKNYIKIGDAVDDDELATVVTAASRAIDNHCNRQFGKVDAPEERWYTPQYDYERQCWTVPVDDLQSTVGLVVTVDDTAVTDYKLEPRNAVAVGKAYTRLVLGPNAEATPWADCEVSVVAPWGWLAVPGAVMQAARLQGSRLNVRRNSPYGIAGSPSIGSELRLLAKLDPDVAVSLTAYHRARRVG